MKRLNRRTLFALAGACVSLGFGSGLAGTAQAASAAVEVARSPTCQCCEAWIGHMRAEGFEVRERLVEDLTPLKMQLGVPAALQSCHTAVVDGYVIEGHVPPKEVRRLLEEKPSGIGLAVPGMPMGSPGMETASTPDTYEVLLFGAEHSTVFARY
ncbi:DUF411 domain-containing protein [Aquamicrobium terrae]|uniref:DUF411 domain-containing protein n=1 Tax=Aquamicrobium terrae TaxID=1324945 RepID=A0ABV2N149_9HYPH